MRISKIIQSLLLSALIVGVFASMARNAYGFTFMGAACIGLALLYFGQWIWRFIDDYSSLTKKDVAGMIELPVLSMFLILLGFRAFYFYFDSSEIIFIVVCSSLLVTYMIMGFEIFTQAKKESSALAWRMGLFYASILLFLLTMLTRVMRMPSTIFGAIAMVISIPIILSVVRRRQFETAGKSITLFQFVASSPNKAGLLFVFFLMAGLYAGLSLYKVIPTIESAEYPKTYVELVNNAESGRETPVEGKYKHESYKEAMDAFLKRHGQGK